MKRIAKVLLATVALSSLFTPIAQSQLWGGRSKNVPASAPSPAASMTLWQARKTIIQQFPRVLQHREWKAGLSFSECRDVNITASGGGTAAGVIHGNVSPPGPTRPGQAKGQPGPGQ